MTPNYLESAIKQFAYYKMLGEKTMEQMSDEQLFWQFNAESNSVATIAKHLWGNMLSRWTDFLTADGEKPWRARDAEFENDIRSREELLTKWNEGWACLFAALDTLTEADLGRTVYIRNQGHTVVEAINRQLAHYPYHVGQVVFIGKMALDENWDSLSIPRGGSGGYNAEKFSHPKEKEHFTDEYLGGRKELNDKTISQRIIDLKNADLELRDRLILNGQLAAGYNEEMEQLHNRNAAILNEIIDESGYPAIDMVGEEASEAAWLVIQHSIGQPNFMKKCLKLLKKAVRENKANPKNLAYLTDRIAVLEGKRQLFGTQFDWDENGALSPNAFDDLDKVSQRRKRIGLNSLEEQTEIMKRQVKNENQSPPSDYEQRKRKIDEWRKAVGWI